MTYESDNKIQISSRQATTLKNLTTYNNLKSRVFYKVAIDALLEAVVTLSEQNEALEEAYKELAKRVKESESNVRLY